MSAESGDCGVAAPPPSESQRAQGRFHPKRKTRGRRLFEAALALLLVLIGAVIGGGVVFVYSNKHRPGPPRPKDIAQNIIRDMDAKLRLTPEERGAIGEIATRRMSNVEQIREDSFSRIREEFFAMGDDFDAILGKDRADIWEADLRERFGDRKWMRDQLEHRRRNKGKPAPRDHE
ncbi:MAG: hypothetical protein LBT97_02455 [Planctomycetota bacterium]|jgi:hypothetical protein|nr:hypothetical protein [Planctomycetota bacterium]